MDTTDMEIISQPQPSSQRNSAYSKLLTVEEVQYCSSQSWQYLME